jgi:hypothetical protein
MMWPTTEGHVSVEEGLGLARLSNKLLACCLSTCLRFASSIEFVPELVRSLLFMPKYGI